MKNVLKITFTGDILCYANQNEACRKLDGRYDYSPIFENVKSLFQDSDYVVGSLETTLSGEDVEYTHSPTSFNTPDSFARALKDVGFDMLTTANNHCWDRGEDGLRRTLTILSKEGFDYTGTRLSEKETNYIIKEFEGTKVAFLSYTYGTNYSSKGQPISVEKEHLVNFTRQPDRLLKKTIIKRIIGRLLRMARKTKSNRGIVLDSVSKCEIRSQRNTDYEEAMIQTIKDAKSKADIVIMCLHSGGQFNSKVGPYTGYLFDIISEAGADAIITNHAHKVLPIYKKGNCVIASALGNFSFVPGEGYYVDGVYAEYSILLEIDIVEKRINQVSFSICKAIKNEDGLAITVPVFDLFEITKDNNLVTDSRIVYEKVTGKSVDNFELKKNFVL